MILFVSHDLGKFYKKQPWSKLATTGRPHQNVPEYDPNNQNVKIVKMPDLLS